MPCLVISIVFALLIAPCGALGSPVGEGCLSGSCHAAFRSLRSVHAPVAAGECDSCHVANGVAHPGQAKGFSLIAAAPALCSRCHEDMNSRPRLHGPVKAGNCGICHDPHAGAGPALLRSPGGQVCFSCHGAIERQIERPYPHPPVAQGDCGACHDPHGSPQRPHLRAFYPRDWYVPFSDDNYTLCFGCHDERAFVYQRTSEVTGFRNGDRNLHFLHVNKPEKGRVCRICHGVHGADQPKLVQSRTPGFGQWDIPVNLTITSTGGTCVAGCHNPKSYDRFRPARNK